MITPQQIQEVSFERALFGGYDVDSVNEFFDLLTEDYIALYKENSVLKSKMKILVEKLEEYRSQELSMKKALVAAQQTSESIIAEAQKKAALQSGPLKVNLTERSVTLNGNKLQLTYKEFELLRHFLQHPGVVFTRDQLFSEIWGMDYYGETRTVDMHIRTLRQKLLEYGSHIQTVRNVGYRWEAE